MAAPSAPVTSATSPHHIGLREWWAILKRTWKAQGEHNTGLLAAGVTYYGFLSIFPALFSVVLVYGLVSSPAEVERQVTELTTGLPTAARETITTQLQTLAATDARALGFGVAATVATALFAASGAVNGLMSALNVVYGEKETRNFVKKRLAAILLTLGAIAFVVVAIFLLTALPPLLDALRLGGLTQALLLALRWLGLVLSFMVAIAVVYRLGPDRADAKLQWVGIGAVTATALWILVSVAVSIYADNFSNYGATYGSLAGVVVLLLWLYLTAYAVLLGAEVNAQAELSTRADTTTGRPEPMGERGAFVADNVAGPDGDPVGPDGQPARPDREAE